MEATHESTIKDIISQQMGVAEDSLTPETNLRDDLGADSLDFVELVCELEEEFDIIIGDDDAEKLVTVGAVVDYIGRRMDKQ